VPELEWLIVQLTEDFVLDMGLKDTQQLSMFTQVVLIMLTKVQEILKA